VKDNDDGAYTAGQVLKAIGTVGSIIAIMVWVNARWLPKSFLYVGLGDAALRTKRLVKPPQCPPLSKILTTTSTTTLTPIMRAIPPRQYG
jgi:hypothetical protein